MEFYTCQLLDYLFIYLFLHFAKNNFSDSQNSMQK